MHYCVKHKNFKKCICSATSWWRSYAKLLS